MAPARSRRPCYISLRTDFVRLRLSSPTVRNKHKSRNTFVLRPYVCSPPSRARTYDTRIKSPLLYQLSYGRIILYVYQFTTHATRLYMQSSLLYRPAGLAMGGFRHNTVFIKFINLCWERDLNPHGLRQECLRLSCLPIPSSQQLSSFALGYEGRSIFNQSLMLLGKICGGPDRS